MKHHNSSILFPLLIAAVVVFIIAAGIVSVAKDAPVGVVERRKKLRAHAQ